MSFDFSTLVTDRTQADVNRVKQIAEKIKNGTASESDLAEFNSAAIKGAYNHTDLNRVTAAMEALKAKLEGYGYAVPGYQRIKVPHVLPEPEPTSRLPEGYTELSYIESTGTQYIDTGVTPNGKSRMVLDFAATDISVTNNIAGARNTTSSQVFTFSTLNGKWRMGYNKASTETSVVADTNRHVADFNQNVLQIDGTAINTATVAEFTAYGSIYLCAIHASAKGYWGYAKLYSCRIYDNGTLVRDYIPCLNPSGEVGLYDLVTAAFFGNSGTGAFVAGAIPRELPEGYTQVEYIQSSGTQYIDSGVIGKSGVEVYAKWMYTVINGGAIAGSLSSKVRFYLAAADSTSWGYGYNDYVGGSAGATANKVYSVYSKLYAGEQKLVVDGAVVATGSNASSYDTNTKMYIFAVNNSGSPLIPSSARLYSLQILDNGVLVRDYVPCTNSGGVAGLYDTVNGVFYQNAGTGAFAAGEEVVAPATAPVMVASGNADECDPYTWYEFDWPTPETMTVYLLNVSTIRAVLAVMKSTPNVPVDMVGLMVQEANNIEKILVDVNELLEKSALVWFYSGDLFAGEVD